MDQHDRRFVVDSWAKSYRESKQAGLIQNSDWFPVMLRQFEKVLLHPRVRVVVAYDPAEKDRIADLYGWLCYEPGTEQYSPLVYYVFIKSAYRRRGLARRLFDAAGIDHVRPFRYACSTYVVDELEKSYWLKRNAPYATFDPIAGRH